MSAPLSRPSFCVARRILLLGSVCALHCPRPASAADIQAGASAPPAPDDILVQLDRKGVSRIVTASDLQAGAPPLAVWPMEPRLRLVRNASRFNQILLLRLAAAPGPVAFSAICTHAACSVSGWNADAQQLVCPCHGSTYSVRERGAIVHGPAARPLPRLPIRMSGATLRVSACFIGRVGGDTGRTM